VPYAGAAPYAGPAPYGGTPYYPPDVAPYSAEEELTGLKDQARYFEGALEEIKKRMGDLESGSEKE
jgi:hypothetical protein